MAFYGSGADELHLACSFPFALSPLDAAELRRHVEDVDRARGP